ncbi:MAG: phosphoribosylformylglycinamidine synthase subunit PurS [Candidatus Omnitrophica bacterium]|nr:phosphoribosylformylglycinamidine synthase subunit PurS [Candidatus Omnitrophota bacterium]MCM8807417.1 phosphoribosylformylglycinamidine synthase subunit PurS [Candidatus Omnitrophota bacterium]
MKNNVQVIMNEKFWIVEIFKKKEAFDVFGKEIKKNIKELGILNVEKVRVSNLYKIITDAGKKNIVKIARDLLVDNISEDFKVYRKFKKIKNFWIVEVFFKEGVTDSVGETAKKTIIESGILKKLEVKTGKKYYIKGNLKEKEVKEICEKLLANTLIQNYFIYPKG